MNSEDVGLSAAEFRVRLCENLKSRGFIDLLKSQIRTKLIAELNRGDGNKLFVGKHLNKGGSSLSQKAVDSLVAHHLLSNSYDYTLSIFIPESGLDHKNMLSIEDILHVLNISPKAIGDCKNNGVLSEIVTKFLSKAHNLSNMETQTDGYHLSLEAKLNQVESFYRRLEGSDRQAENDPEKFELLKQVLQEKMKSETELKVLKFKKKEISTLRKEERDKHRQDLEKYKQEVDRIYHDRLQSVIRREQDVNATYKEKEISLEKETFRQRQLVLEEISRLREREEVIKKREDDIQREKKTTEDKFISFEEMMKKREVDVEEARKEVENRVWSEVQRYKLEIEKQYQERFIATNIKEDLLADKEKSLELRNAEIESLMTDVYKKTEMLTMAEKEINDLKANLHLNKVKHDQDLIELMELKKSSEDLNTIKEELAETRRHLAKVLREGALEKQELSEELSHLRGEGEQELRNLREQNKQLRDNLVLVQEMADKMTSSLQSQLNKEIHKNKELHVKLTSLVSRQQTLCNELVARVDVDTTDNVAQRPSVVEKKSKTASTEDDISSASSTPPSSGKDVIKEAKRRLEKLSLASENLDLNMQRVITSGEKFMTKFPEAEFQQRFPPANIRKSQQMNSMSTHESLSKTTFHTSNKLHDTSSSYPELLTQFKNRISEKFLSRDYNSNQIPLSKNNYASEIILDPKLPVTALRERISKNIKKMDLNFIPKITSMRCQKSTSPIRRQWSIDVPNRGHLQYFGSFDLETNAQNPHSTKILDLYESAWYSKNHTKTSEIPCNGGSGKGHNHDNYVPAVLYSNDDILSKFESFPTPDITIGNKLKSGTGVIVKPEPTIVPVQSPPHENLKSHDFPNIGGLKDVSEPSNGITFEKTNVVSLPGGIGTKKDLTENAEVHEMGKATVKELIEDQVTETKSEENHLQNKGSEGEVFKDIGEGAISEMNKYMELVKSASVTKKTDHSNSSSESDPSVTEDSSVTHASSVSGSETETVSEKLEVPPVESDNEDNDAW